MLSRAQAEKRGLAARNHLRRAELARIGPRKFDPIAVLCKACKGHVVTLVPEKFKRMSVSPFTFFRGAVELMAGDMGGGPHTHLEVQLCGDAHLKNFGFFATPGSDVVFDINDFDETTRGPWEWDVKRAATSIILAGRVAGDSGAACKQAAQLFLSDYCDWIHRFARMTVLEVARHRTLLRASDPVLRGALKEAERATPSANLAQLAHGNSRRGYHFNAKPNLIWEIKGAARKAVLAALPEYRRSLAPDRQMIFDRYRLADVGFKVVGTGSVGTRDYVLLLFGHSNDAKDPLFLQIKEELPSAYAPYYKDASSPRNQGERVVQGQRAMQVLSDLLLGWCSIDGRDYLVRQLNDHKSAIAPEELGGKRLTAYSCVCAELLAKGHARSGDPVALSAYLGRSEKAQLALLRFAVQYADQTEADFATFGRAQKRDELKINH